MSAQNSKRLILWIGIPLVVLALVVSGYFVLANFQRPGAEDLPQGPPPSVLILDPQHNSQVSLGSPVVVDVEARAGVPIMAIELWIDGQLMGFQQGDGEPSEFFLTSFVWTPKHPGSHAIVARAIGADNPLAFSNAIHLHVVQPVFDADAADLTDFNIPEVIPPAEDAVQITDLGGAEAVVPALPVSDPGSLPFNDPAQTPPQSPQIVINAAGCSSEIIIQDLSTDEDGFNLYRQASNLPGWTKVAVLQSHDGTGSIGYSEPVYPGGFSYYAAAFNGGGESPSNLAMLNIDPSDCPDGAGESTLLAVDLAELLSASDADKAYCYRTLDGARWERVPAEGYIFPGADPATGKAFSLLNLNALGQGVEGLMMNLHLDCWGWQGGSLLHLGAYNHSFDLSKLALLAEGLPGTEFGSALQLMPASEAPSFYPLGIKGGAFQWNSAMAKINFFQQDPSMPYFYPFVTNDPDICMSHLPADAQNLIGQILFCAPYPGFTSGMDSENPQPYLVWNPTVDCPLGQGTPPCMSYQDWRLKAEQEGGDLRFTIKDVSSAGSFAWHIGSGDLRNWVIKPLDCAGTRQFQVRMYYVDQDEFLMGPESIQYSIDCPHTVPWEIPLEITWESIRFYNLDDGDSTIPQDVEVFGYMLAVTSLHNRYLNLAKWNQQASNCPDEAFHASLDAGGTKGAGCTRVFQDVVPYDLSEVELCQGTSKYNCSIAGFKTENNKVRINVQDGDGLYLQTVVVDWDDSSGNDLQCMWLLMLPPKDRFAWAQVQDQSFTLNSPSWGSGSCTIRGSISAVLP